MRLVIAGAIQYLLLFAWPFVVWVLFWRNNDLPLVLRSVFVCVMLVIIVVWLKPNDEKTISRIRQIRSDLNFWLAVRLASLLLVLFSVLLYAVSVFIVEVVGQDLKKSIILISLLALPMLVNCLLRFCLLMVVFQN